MANSAENKGKPSQADRLRSYLASTAFLTMGLFWVAFLIAFGGFIIIQLISPPSDTLVYTELVILIAIPWLIAGCVFMILRKEVIRPGLPSIKGKWAVVQGIVGLILLTYAEVYGLYLFWVELHSK